MLPELPEVLKNGLPGAISQLCIFLRGLVLNALIVHFVGNDGLSAYSSIQSFGSVYWAVPAGVTSAVTVLGSIYAGEEDRASIVALMETFLKRGAVLVLLVSLTYSLLCFPLTNLFFHDPALPFYHMTMLGFMLFPLSSPLSTLTVGFSNCFQCLGHHHIVRAVTFCDGFVAMVLLSLMLVPLLGMTGVWIAQIGSGVVLLTILFLYASIRNKGVPKSLEQMLCIPATLGAPDEDRIDDVIDLADRVELLCRSHGIDSRRTYSAALCVEELAVNIIRHGAPHTKSPAIDIRVSCLDDSIRISLKDNCKAFDPKEAASLFDPEDKAHNIGLRLVGLISKSMTYQNTLGLNMLSIVV